MFVSTIAARRQMVMDCTIIWRSVPPLQGEGVAFSRFLRGLLVRMIVALNKNKRVLLGTSLYMAGLLCCWNVIYATASVPANFVLIHGGEFMMGSQAGEVNREQDESLHKVKVSSFYMSRYEVTVADFRAFVEETGYRTDAEQESSGIIFLRGWLQGKACLNWRDGVSGRERSQVEENQPVLLVSWNDAVAYCKWLSEKKGRPFRLPTEAEWEYACRAGTQTPFNTGSNITTSQANYDGNYPYSNYPQGVYRKNTLAVDSFIPNAWGLYNMHGNVAEWCSDWYGEEYYDASKAAGVAINPVGPSTGKTRVIRGGSWNDDARFCRSADRNDSTQDYRYINVGFRIVFSE